eukprot:12411986-Karenia_brevis.AAC.1
MREFRVSDVPGEDPIAVEDPPGAAVPPAVTSPIEDDEETIPEDVDFRILETRIRRWGGAPDCPGCIK